MSDIMTPEELIKMAQAESINVEDQAGNKLTVLLIDDAVKLALDYHKEMLKEDCKKAYESGWKEGADHMYGSGRDNNFNPFSSK